jgi:hypothetical protein
MHSGAPPAHDVSKVRMSRNLFHVFHTAFYLFSFYYLQGEERNKNILKDLRCVRLPLEFTYIKQSIFSCNALYVTF